MNYIVVKTNPNVFEIAYEYNPNKFLLNGRTIVVPDDAIERHKFFSSKWYFTDVFSVITYYKSLMNNADDPYMYLDAKKTLELFTNQYQIEFPEILL